MIESHPLFSVSQLLRARRIIGEAATIIRSSRWVQSPSPAIDHVRCESDAMCMYAALQRASDSYDVPAEVLFYVRKSFDDLGFKGTIVQFNDEPGRTKDQVAEALDTAISLLWADIRGLQ